MFTSGQYVITSRTGDNQWHGVTAKTLRAAKSAASKMYQLARGGSIEVGIARDEYSVDTVAVKKYGVKWHDWY